MAFLIDTGIVGKVVDLTIAPVGRQVGYLIYYNQNVESLQDKLVDLVAASEDVERKVGEEKRNIREVENCVNKWLTDVQKIRREANEILNQENKEKMKCLCGFCPNLVLRHQLSRKSTKLVPDIAKLYEKKDFVTFAHATPPQDPPTKDYEVFGSRTFVVNEIMDVLRNSHDIGRIGVYGLGGVGKTTLLKEISRQATQDKKLFDDVVMILDVKQNPSIDRIQKEIAEKLELKLPDETTTGRAGRLYSRIKDQKTLIILDDVWERIDLHEVGLPVGATCRVLLTSRSRDVLSNEMHAQRYFVLNPLEAEESQNLFEKMAGDVIKDLAIKRVAKKVAKRCGGLPVLVVTVASALKNRRSVHAWEDALIHLKRFDKEKKFIEKTYLALEWSYIQLDDEELKSLFLLCGFYADSYSKTIYILDLFKYGFGLGLFKNLDKMGDAWVALNSLLEKLKDSCLLLDHEKSGCVGMHDLVHDVAKRILSRDQIVLIERSGDELKEWPDNKDFCEKCTMIFLQVSNIPKHLEVLQCTELKLFVLAATGEDYSLEIPCNFFQEMAKLSVLDLTSLSLPSLPPSLKFLKSLKTLCLDWCILEDIALIGQLQNLEMLSFRGSDFKELPKEIGKLTRLRSLDVTNCSQLEIISRNVLSSLKKLEELRMGNSFNQWDTKGVISTEKNNASLSELKHLSKLSNLEIHILDANILPTGLFSKALKRYRIYIGAVWNWDDEDANLNTLKIKLTTSNELYQSGVNMLLKRTDELHLNGMEAGKNTAYQSYFDGFQQLKHLHVHNAEFRDIINGEGVFPNLKRLVVSDLHGLKFLLSSFMARSLVQLTHLEISQCQTMEEIISTDEYDEKHMNDMFSKLQHLELKDLPILTRFCSRSYIGSPSLEISQLKNCNEIEERDSRENLRNVFFDKKVVFPSLKRLFINGLTKLMTLWHSQLSAESFKNLETVDIRSCQSLKSVFPSSIVHRLQQLMHLKVVHCGVEEIIANADRLQTTHEFVFSKVNSVRFEDLPHLRCFYPGMHPTRWLSLEDLMVLGCCKVAFLAQECSSFERNFESTNPTPTNQALFLIKKDSFPNLKRVNVRDMDIWDGPIPVKFFSKLESLQVSNQLSKSAVLEKFLDLENPSVTSFAASDEISFHEKSHSGDINAVGALPHLSELLLYGISKLMHLWEDDTQSAGQNIPNLIVLEIRNCDSLRNLRSSAISFKNLTKLEVIGCPELEYLITYSTAKSFMQLKVLSVGDCAKMVEIVGSTEDDNSGNEIVFSRLEYLALSKLPRLRGFCSGDCVVRFPPLEISQLKNYNETEKRDSKENLGNVFFDKKVVFPSLKRLFINGLTKLTTLWHSQLSPESFKNLETVDIRSCQSLKSVFPSSIVHRLQQLMHLKVVHCGVEEIIANADRLQTTHEFVFSKVNSVRFEDLPHLRCFYPGMHATRWLSLEDLMVLGCCKVAFLAQECSSFERNFESTNPTPTNQALFLIKKDSFPDLKRVNMRDMDIWDGPIPVEFFSKLESLQVSNQHSKSVVLEKFLDLEKPRVTSFAASNEISFHEESRSGDINAVGALPHLSRLRLYGMSKLMHLWEDDTQSAGQNIPNLIVLEIRNCDSLRNLRSSAISFKNLTNMEVTGCPELDYLVNYSTAKSLMQLEVLSVGDCAKMVEIVGSTEDDDSGNEIVFDRLEYLALSKLPRLRGFCSGDCTVRFPSLETLSISKRLKLKMFHNDERVSSLQITDENVDTDVDVDDVETVTKEKVDIDIGVGGEQIDETIKITNKNEDANVDGLEHVQPLEISATDQGVIAPMEENLAIIPVGQVTTPVFPVIESAPVAEVPHTEEVGEQAFSGQNLKPLAEEARHDVHQTPNAPEQPVEERSDPLKPSVAATGTPTPTIPALPPPSSLKSSGTKRSLREKLQALSSKKAASSSGLPEEAKAKLKALIATADLKDPHTRQQLLAVLPTLQLSTTKWIADLTVQELSKLPLVLDKEESLCQELAALKAQGSELDVRSHKLLSEVSLAEEYSQKIQKQKVELLALEEQIKKLEVRAISLRDEIALGEKRYSGFEASLDQLVEEQQLNQLSVDSTSQELLRTRAVSDSLRTAIFTYLCQLL